MTTQRPTPRSLRTDVVNLENLQRTRQRFVEQEVDVSVSRIAQLAGMALMWETETGDDGWLVRGLDGPPGPRGSQGIPGVDGADAEDTPLPMCGHQDVSPSASPTFQGLRLSALPAFVTGDTYLVVDALGNLHLSAIGPAI